MLGIGRVGTARDRRSWRCLKFQCAPEGCRFSLGACRHLHATHWHDDLGIPKSHGCINLSPDEA